MWEELVKMTCEHDVLVRPEGKYETNEYVCQTCKKPIKSSALPVRRTIIQRPQQKAPPPQYQQPRPSIPSPPPQYYQPEPPRKPKPQTNVIQDSIKTVQDFIGKPQKDLTGKFFEDIYSDGKKRRKKK
jgi:hypothetical protein